MIRKAVTALTAALVTTSAGAATIDFEAEHGRYEYTPYSFVEDGFLVSYEPISVFGFNLVDDPAEHLGMCNPGCPSNGTTAFYAFNESGITIELAGGGLFSLASLDAAGTFTQMDRPLTLMLTGIGTGGTVTTTIFATPEDAETFTTYLLDGFTNLSSLTIMGGPVYPEFSIDNLVVTAAAVPEPASWALMIGGLGVMGGAVRRRRATVRLA